MLFKFICLHPADHHPVRIRKANKDFSREFGSKDINFFVKIRDIQKTEKRKIVSISVFSNKKEEKHSIYMSKSISQIHANLLLTGEKVKRNEVVNKQINTFIYAHTLHRGRKYFLIIAHMLSVQQNY